MPKEDYLIKELEKIKYVIAAILNLRANDSITQGINMANETFKELLNLDITGLSVLSGDEFIDLVTKENNTSSYLEAWAHLSYETSDLLYLNEDTKKAESLSKQSLQLFHILNKKDKTFSFEREAIIEELEKRVGSNGQ